MEHAARRFAQNILLLHLVILIGVIALVVAASRDVYDKARDEALHQAQTRQELLAAQTARGIESFYESILDNLDLLRRADQPATDVAAPAPEVPPMIGVRGLVVAPILWKQLEDRVSHLLVVDVARRNVHTIGTSDPSVDVQQLVETAHEWLAALDQPAVSRHLPTAGAAHGGGVNLVAVPLGSKFHRVIVAVVPASQIQQRFFRELGSDASTGGTLVDETLQTIATTNKFLAGASLEELDDPRLRELARGYVEKGKIGTEVLEVAPSVKGAKLNRAQVTGYPVRVADGNTRWELFIASDLGSADTVVRNLFRRTIYWALFVIVSMTAVLVSTAVQLIRSRVRLERVRHEMLHRELTQARQIQLAWLPEHTSLQSLDLVALNEPASHISGDFYNWFNLEGGRVVVTIGDVTGHGMAAAFLMATTQLLVRTTMARVGGDPGKCLEEVNRQLCSQVFNGQFVTMLIVVLDVENGSAEVATAGHPPPLLGEGDEFRVLTVPPQLVLGVEKDTVYPTERYELSPSSSLVLYTDGVIDAQSPTGERFTIEGLQRSLYGKFDSAQSIIDTIVTAIDEFRGERELGDDVTLVTIQLQSAAVQRGSGARMTTATA